MITTCKQIDRLMSCIMGNVARIMKGFEEVNEDAYYLWIDVALGTRTNDWRL